ncbi:hypothetical protein ACIQ9J_01220 [Streptomyces sp. NPDC094153]|uniref:hypothetical protein n=1 Tax=Streptomyces sp. NPDC094153 TaxID=3366058 RepID=UPI00382224A1
MSGKRPDEAVRLSGGRAAGHCWVQRPSGPGHCAMHPGRSGDHVDHYNGRASVTAISGHRWPR